LGTIKSLDGQSLCIDKSASTVASVLYDAVFIPGGESSTAQLLTQGNALHFVAETYKHFKTIGASGTGADFLKRTGIPGLSISDVKADEGVANLYGIIIASKSANLHSFSKEFITALAQDRHWTRPNHEQIPA
jgi:catalase